MQAGPANQSSICVHFGQHTAPSPPGAQVDLTMRLFHPQYQTIRNDIISKLNTQLPNSCFALQIPLHQADAQQIATRLNSSEELKIANQQGAAKLNFHSASNTLFAILENQEMLQVLHQFQALLEPVKNKAQEQPSQVCIKVSSQNDLSKVGELLKAKGPIGALDSLGIELRFIKTEVIEQLVGIILENFLQMPQKAGIVRSFRRVNMQLNCVSSRHLADYPKLRLPPPPPPVPSNQVVQILKEAGATQGTLYFLNEALFAQGSIQLQGLSAFLAVLYG